VFKDYYSGHAPQYSSARPTYPTALFEYLMTHVKGRNLAWDCATGNGQAAVKLAPYFKSVIATDGSKTQLAEAKPCSNIEYRVATAGDSSLESGSVDLITVATAVHWFDFDEFYQEAKRVIKHNGIIAVWGYGLFYTDNLDFNQLINTFYTDIFGEFWPPELKHVDSGYKTIPFPFVEITPTPQFDIVKHWNIKQIIAFLQTWSAIKQYQARFNENPVEQWLLPRLSTCMIDVEKSLTVTWPLALKVGYIA
jgi:SAM-dependent methyltransferase